MTNLPLIQQSKRTPRPANGQAASVGHERWLEQAAGEADHTGDESLLEFAQEIAVDPAARALLDAVFGNSPFLTDCILKDIGFARLLFQGGVEQGFAMALGGCDSAAVTGDMKALMQGLRIAKRQAALSIALADITGQWSLAQVTGALTELAERSLEAGASHLLRALAERGKLPLADPEHPTRGSGLVILGMGKLGARELNYSSDIDLIVLYDDECPHYADIREHLRQPMVRLTQDLVRIIEERTADGYVFRTDLRLRPDPGATPVAVSVAAAESYYTSVGQNWERAAMIKARPVAGDIEAGERFLSHIDPYIWRKHLDFAAIQDIHSIKRQIAAHKGGRTIAMLGHNVKLGRGGIREIEFFAQTQQLIWGGRIPDLRLSDTCGALDALVRAERITAEAAQEMKTAYGFLRDVEHRLQMIEDMQTQTLPKDEAGIERLAVFLNYPDAAAFQRDLLHHLHIVETHYSELFEESPSLTVEGEEARGNLVFTGGENDPDTLETLAEMGYQDPDRVANLVRGWHHGRYRATRSERARQILTELMPALLRALSRAGSPDTAFLRFDQFLSRLPAGVQLFSMFQVNPRLLESVAQVMGGAPFLAEQLSRRPGLLESVLTEPDVTALQSAEALQSDLAQALYQANDYQDTLDVVRRWNNDRRFLIGLNILSGRLDADAAGPLLSLVAEAAIHALLPQVEQDFARLHGAPPGPEGAPGGMAIVALGKLGGQELTIGSDLDLVFLYNAPIDAMSEGPRPLSAVQYYARLGQRLISALTVQTGEGDVYPVDMRLRPSGKTGPIASSLESFAKYYADSAWRWEFMALTRARMVAGPAHLTAAVTATIRTILTRPHDPAGLVFDVADMRARIAREKPGKILWDVKLGRGGLVDAEFIAQYLQLRHASENPDVLHQNTTEAFARLIAAGYLDPADGAALIEATRLWRRLQGLLRLAIGEAAFDEATATQDQKAALVQAGGAVDFETLKQNIEAIAARSQGLFETLVDRPAAAHKPDTQETTK
ncbi:MAG: bifunctional [glutamine synthetase] adenylyltransferase/[glutamine synthetase]-adenylyl-L-tyrosine phosphorylase [Alphaproteobacteria bacterium]|nr:bifunctional [glutamine synthetase] adenylyltransferase/[glutamine synthetase]-adenylyl-L-tyrosine phosphorylase [Alphaproteobacteria bacterium]MBU0798037.1 bifunctional [glutamine synthetase] adenylyltransferase/[glutamine synthetase]-adenylyl-L-tyrosine phosphorylase [Alphaproteobacteria bacterium]MBU0887406.1 bifunctional [glutamine synthetase] adenylyltransferase/[glutamine synthetase]-adenylyl-L-tyrosine phosphorylase [Alphaproteobacteria bacterium]MBU1811713.1 bifunctional [glutamine sy